jgi:hypothetical protein
MMKWSLVHTGAAAAELQASLRRERNNIVVEWELVSVRTRSCGSDLRSRARGNIVERVGDRACRHE